MIEVDGLMAAVVPTPNASPSTDAPAEFAAAMAVVGGEAGHGGAEPGPEQHLAAHVGDTEPVDSASLQPSTPSLVGTAALLDPAVADAMPDAGRDTRVVDGRELDLSALVGMVPATTPTTTSTTSPTAPALPRVALAPELVVDDATAKTPTVSASAARAEIGVAAPTNVADSPIDPAAIATTAESVSPVPVAAPVTDAAAVDTIVDAVPADEAPIDPRLVKPSIAAEAPASPSTTRPELARAALTGNDDDPTKTGVDTRVDDSAVPLAASERPADAAVGTAAPTPHLASTGGPVSMGERLDADSPDVAVPGIDTRTTSPTAAPSEPGADVAASAAPSTTTPAVELPTSSVQPPVVSAPGPRTDVTVTEVADVAPPPSTSTPEATPTQQVAEALREVRRLADGSHRLSLQLHPEELGAVQLEVAIRDGQLHVRAVAETDAARTALEHNLPELRSDLREAGVRAGSLEVGPDASGRERPDSSDRDTRTERHQERGADEPSTPIPDPSTASGLDIRL